MSDRERCRLVLLADTSSRAPEAILSALNGGDVASVILYTSKAEDAEFMSVCSKLVPQLQSKDAAVLIRDDTQVFGRSGADGIHLEKTRNLVEESVARFSPHNIVGCGGYKDRHGAMEAGEQKPDFVLFGKCGGDIKEDTHPKNLANAEWWSNVVQVPCILLGGQKLSSVIECAETGAEFVALEAAVFNAVDPADAVREANALLDRHAPELIDED